MELPKSNRGFTLIELVVVIGVLSVLLAIVLVAINPARQFAQANNTQRRSDVSALLNAIHQYAADRSGSLPAGLDATSKTICSTGGTITCPVDSIDLCADLVPVYIADLPLDPTAGDEDPENSVCTSSLGYDTGYTASASGAAAGNRVTIAAPGAELSEVIQVTR